MQVQKSALSINFHRIVALWAFIECSLGGLAHAFKLPFTALYVGGGSMFCIVLIGRHVASRKIFEALASVLSIKFLLNPHSPIGAYLAVSFQALLGYLLFRFLPYFRLNVILLFCIGFLESALQKVLVLSFLYGENLYKVLDKVLKDFSGLLGLGFIPNTLHLFGIYVAFYAFSGLIVGFLLANYVLFLEKKDWQSINEDFQTTIEEKIDLKNSVKGTKKMYFSLLFLLFLVIFLYFSGEKTSWWSALLSVLAIFLWFSGVLNLLLRYFLPKQSLQYQKEIVEVLPQIRKIWYLSWQKVMAIPLLQKPFVFLHTFVVNVLFIHNLPFYEKTDK
jgi:hypothetical protein